MNGLAVDDALEAAIFADAPSDQADHKHGDENTERTDDGRPDATGAQAIDDPDQAAQPAAPAAHALPVAGLTTLARFRDHTEHEAAGEAEADCRCDNQSKSDNRVANSAENRDENVHVVSPDFEFLRRTGPSGLFSYLIEAKPN
ncbi:MAG: hypothetical protein WC714_19655 [Candidatus Obscuribacterales bacterium]